MMKLSVRTRAPPSSAEMSQGSTYAKTPITSSFTSCFRGGGLLSPRRGISEPIVDQSTVIIEDSVKYYRKLSQNGSIEGDAQVHKTEKSAKQRSKGSSVKVKEQKKTSSCSTSTFATMLWSPRKSGKVIQLSSSPIPCASDHDGHCNSARRRKSLRTKVKEAYEQVLEATRKGGPYVNDVLLVGNHLFMPMSPASSPASSPRPSVIHHAHDAHHTYRINRSSSSHHIHDPLNSSHRHHSMASARSAAPSHFGSRGRPEEAIGSSPVASSPVMRRDRGVQRGSRSGADFNVSSAQRNGKSSPNSSSIIWRN